MLMFFGVQFSKTVAHCCRHDPAPVGVIPVESGLHQVRIRYCKGGLFRIGLGCGITDDHFDEF